jgi:hypothetical protein
MSRLLQMFRPRRLLTELKRLLQPTQKTDRDNYKLLRRDSEEFFL